MRSTATGSDAREGASFTAAAVKSRRSNNARIVINRADMLSAADC